MTISPPAELLGSRSPAHRSAPSAPQTWGPEVRDLAASAELVLDPPQADVLDDGLADDESRWAASEVAVIEPRQNGKGAILEARALGGLFLFKEPLILWSAHEFKTAREGFLRVRALVDNYDHLRKRVKAVRVAAGEEGIEMLDGCRLRFLARSGGSGRGFSGDCVFLDEAYALTDDQMSALMPTISARPNPQIWYMSSAPLPTSSVLRRICKRGRAGGAPGLVYYEWCAAKDALPTDPQAWCAANPAFGIRIFADSIERELGTMGPEEFARERLGVWREEDAEQVIDPEKWASLVDAKSQPSDPVAFALDITPDRSSASIGVVGLRPDGSRHAELVDKRPGIRWVIPRLLELVERWQVCAVALDPSSPAGSLIPELHKNGITAEPEKGQTRLVIVGASAMAQACGAWFDAVIEDHIRHLDQGPLNLALAGARQRHFGDEAWKWSRKDSTVDISPLVAITIADYAFALYGHVKEEESEPWFVFGYSD